MSFKPRNLLLFGATGQIGTFILDALLSARDNFERIAIFTSQNTAETKADSLAQLKKNGVEIIVGEISDEEAVGKAYEGMNLFSTSSKEEGTMKTCFAK
jgi:1-deoxy-D-xylulose 5-phosphate reductoisomerase